MSLSKADNKQLREWFSNLDLCTENGTNLKQTLNDYYSYREKISKLVLLKLDDLFVIKKSEWFTRNKIQEDDTISIIHDSLLVALDKFDIKNNVRFITFFWTVLHRRLFNFINKHKKVKLYNTRFIPDMLFRSLDAINDSKKLVSPKWKFWLGESSYVNSAMPFKLDYDHDLSSDYRFFLEDVLAKLSEQQKFIVTSVLKGYSLSDIAKSLSVSSQTVGVRLKKIRDKFKNITYDK